MRIPTKLIFDRRTRDILENQRRLFELQERISSGRRILRPSDDVLGFLKAGAVSVEISKRARDVSDVADAINFLEFTDEILAKVENILVDAKTNALRGMNATDEEELRAFARSVRELYQKAVEFANIKFRGRFIFAGGRLAEVGDMFRRPFEDRQVLRVSNWTSPEPFTPPASAGSFKVIVYDGEGNILAEGSVTYSPEDTAQSIASKIVGASSGLLFATVLEDGRISVSPRVEGVTFSLAQDTGGLIALLGGDGVEEYNGDFQPHTVEASGRTVEVTLVGREVFGDPSEGVEGVLTVLRELADVLEGRREGDRTELLQMLADRIDAVFRRISEVRVSVGERIRFLRDIEDELEFSRTRLEVRRSDIEDIDTAEAGVELALRENILRASLAIAVRSFELTLARFL